MAKPSLPPRDPYEGFLAAFWKDHELGAVRRLAEYLALFPGADDQVTEEYISLRAQDFATLLNQGKNPDLLVFSEGLPSDIAARLRESCVRHLASVHEGATESEHHPFDLGESPVPSRIAEFRLIREIGHGGMGIVYLAEDLQLRRNVALKIIPRGLPVAQRLVEQLRHEAAAAARLHHAGIVPIYRVGEDAGIHFIAMEYVEGMTLGEKLARTRDRAIGGPGSVAGATDVGGHKPETIQDAPTSRWRRGTPDEEDSSTHEARVAAMLDPVHLQETAGIVAQVADALHYAHQNGVIHRDVKPLNIVIEPGGRARLLDFGLAKDLAAVSISVPGELAGTYAYMSPEQASAKRNTVDHRTDVFSLGIVLYEMLTLQRPFRGRTSQRILYEIAFATPKPPRRLNPRVPRDLETVCMKALEKEPRHRYATAEAMATDLRRFLAHEAIVAEPPSLFRCAARHARRRAAFYAGASSVLVLAIAGLFVTVHSLETRRIREAVDPLREIATGSALVAFDLPQLIAARDRALLLLRDADLDTDGKAVARAALARIEGRATELEIEARTSLSLGQESPPGTPFKDFRVQSDPDYFNGLVQLWNSRVLFGEKAGQDATELMLATFPQVEVQDGPPGADVFVAVIDALKGTVLPRRRLGQVPLPPTPIAPGLYRFTVVEKGRGTSELTRNLERRGRSVRLIPTIRPDAETKASMLRITAGDALVGSGTNDASEYFDQWNERHVDVEEFYIDALEVSNAQYRRFVEATGHRPPKTWRLGYDAAWDELPVVGVTWFDAQEYAEWSGKRLPTDVEWQKAARGSSGFDFPWGNDERSPDWRSVAGPPAGPPPSWPLPLHHGLRPVGTQPLDRSPFGLMDGLGNVREWTESPWIHKFQGAFTVDFGARIVRSHGWNSGSRDEAVRLSSLHYGPIMVDYVGFRCAKSSLIH